MWKKTAHLLQAIDTFDKSSYNKLLGRYWNPVGSCTCSQSWRFGLLKSLFDSKKIVAKGSIRSIDPDHDVGGKRLGLNWCEVQISVPIEWDEDLIRPYSNLSTIGDAIGTCIAWPRHLVLLEEA